MLVLTNWKSTTERWLDVLRTKNTWGFSNWVTKSRGRKLHTLSPVFPPSASFPLNAKVDPCNKPNVYFGVRGIAPDDRNFFVVVSFAFLEKIQRPAGIDESYVHHQRSLAVHHISPNCVCDYQKVNQGTLQVKVLIYHFNLSLIQGLKGYINSQRCQEQSLRRDSPKGNWQLYQAYLQFQDLSCLILTFL